MEERGTCLVIEDDEDIAGLLEVIIEASGFDVAMALSGADGLQLAAELHLTLITLDLGRTWMAGQSPTNSRPSAPPPSS